MYLTRFETEYFIIFKNVYSISLETCLWAHNFICVMNEKSLTHFEPIFDHFLLIIGLRLMLVEQLLVDAVEVEIEMKLYNRYETKVQRAYGEQPQRAVEKNIIGKINERLERKVGRFVTEEEVVVDEQTLVVVANEYERGAQLKEQLKHRLIVQVVLGGCRTEVGPGDRDHVHHGDHAAERDKHRHENVKVAVDVFAEVQIDEILVKETIQFVELHRHRISRAFPVRISLSLLFLLLSSANRVLIFHHTHSKRLLDKITFLKILFHLSIIVSNNNQTKVTLNDRTLFILVALSFCHVPIS
jgi:hypothetical protein